jgi:hypothetical protein
MKNSLFIALMALSTQVGAEVVAASTTKTYMLSHLESVVSNSEKCDPFYQDLKHLTEKPLALKFSKDSEKKEHAVEDLSGQIKHHSHTTIQQREVGHKVIRVGIGAFEYNHQMIDYVISVSANADNPKQKHLYPVILSSDDGQCYYTGLVEASAETGAAFKKKIHSGEVHKQIDLVK